MPVRQSLRAIAIVVGPILIGITLYLLLPNKRGVLPITRLKWAESPKVEVYLGNELLDKETVITGEAGTSNLLVRAINLQIKSASKEKLRDLWVSISVCREMKEWVVPTGDFDVDGFERDPALVGFRTT